MDAEIKTAYLIAEALTAGKSLEELARLQITLQTISSLVAAELASRRRGSNVPQSGAGK